MTLREKLNRLYADIECLEKSKHNKSQNYDYVPAVLVVRTVRKALIDLKVYAEINFTFEGQPYTIARAKEPNAPFSAVNVRCTVKFLDLESLETSTHSGLGSGADLGDKAVYKAQTGALKYALKNACLAPDERDPEADESVDNGGYAPEMPAYEDWTGATAHAQMQPAPQPAREPGDDTDSLPPTEEQMAEYRKQFQKLGDDLSTNGKLKSSRGLPINRKLLVFLLHITKADDAKNITKGQWDNFFERVDAVKTQADGMIGLAKLVNKVNGVEDKKDSL